MAKRKTTATRNRATPQNRGENTKTRAKGAGNFVNFSFRYFYSSAFVSLGFLGFMGYRTVTLLRFLMSKR